MQRLAKGTESVVARSRVRLQLSDFVQVFSSPSAEQVLCNGISLRGSLVEEAVLDVADRSTNDAQVLSQ